MAGPATEVLASPTPAHHPDNAAVATASADRASHALPRDAMSSAFQAVNARGAAESKSSAAGNSQASATKPDPKGASAIQDASQLTQTSPVASVAVKPSPPQPDAQDAVMADSATYGTRSRNRHGNSRPNYAEDQDMDFEYTAASNTTKKTQPVNDASPGAPNASEAKRAHEFARFIAVNSGANANETGTKDSTPASTAPPTGSKKRKAAGASATIAQTPATSTVPASSGAPKKATSSASAAMARETNILTFSRHKNRLNAKGELVADDGTKLGSNDHVYLVCEPPGDPYYLCRIMEFLHVRSDDPSSPVDALRVNWYYRPRDVLRFNSDTRLVYGTMHSDICPLSSVRGKCTIKHRSEIGDLEAYRKERDSFYFVQIFDRFIRRWYECIPVAQIINVPEKVKKALDERWKFVVVEAGRVKELTSAVKTCKRCAKFCASHDSVDCAICKNSYHMNCVQPPLPKKPSRGFAWACGPCSRASERKLEQRNTPNASGNVTEVEEEELVEEEQPSASSDTTRAPSPSGSDMIEDEHTATQADIALAKMWPMRYFGIHCRVEDALHYDDRGIYPRASIRLGPRHQANVTLWYDHPVELIKPAEIKRRYNKGNNAKKDPKVSKETQAALEAEREKRAKRPKWVQDEPPGYVRRGEDYPNKDSRNTAKLLFQMPPMNGQSERGLEDKPSPLGREAEIDEYIRKAKGYAKSIGVPPFGANFLDKALELLCIHNYNQDVALKRLAKMDRVADLHEPVLSRAELVKFEEGVAKYGSEARLVHRHMKTELPLSTIVRFYYLWKKTPKGQDIWGNYGGRKGSKQKVENDASAQLHQSVADDADDSAFDMEKVSRNNRSFICKFCNAIHSRQWRRAPGVSPGQMVMSDGKNGKEKGTHVLALCIRCAGLWRKYAIQWEDIGEVAKKVSQGSGKAWKRKIDEELLREIVAANEASNQPGPDSAPTAAPAETNEPAKKKVKGDSGAEPVKKKEKPPPPPKEPTPPPPPIIPNQPEWRDLPCAICKDTDGTIECVYCKLTVHRHCFGLEDDEGTQSNGEVRWVCEQCQNDRTVTVSTDYACCLCLTEETNIDLVAPPRVSHKKKSDRDREKERMEKELADAMREDYKNKQLAMHRPALPREPLKRTTGNNWVHVYCAVFTPEIRFSDARLLEAAEGFQQIPAARHEAVCKLCKNKDHQNKVREDKGSCVTCFQCHANIHVSCAFEAGYIFGFDVTPVKGSRKDQITTATLGGETGSLTAGIWCKEHVVKSTVHPLNELADAETGKTALQIFVENYKQADLSLTGTLRKANLAQSTRERAQLYAGATGNNNARRDSAANNTRRESTATNGIAAAVRRGARTSSVPDTKTDAEDGISQHSQTPEASKERKCAKCGLDVTPRWHCVVDSGNVIPPKSSTSPDIRMVGVDLENGSSNYQGSGQTNPQNIRFMAPGASGRAWEGVPERFAHHSTTNGTGNGDEDWIAPVNGEGGNPNGSFAGSGFPSLPQQAVPKPIKTAPEYLCHKCFVKKKLNRETPPPDRPMPPSERNVALPEQQNTGTFDPTKPIRMPQDEPPPPPTESLPPPSAPPGHPSQIHHQPPLPVNGPGQPMQYGPPPPTFSHYGPLTPGYPGPTHHGGPPPQHSGPPPLQRAGPPTPQHASLPPPQQMNGPPNQPHNGPPPQYAVAPPPHSGPPHVHERQGSHGYNAPPQPQGAPYPPYGSPHGGPPSHQPSGQPPRSSPYPTYPPPPAPPGQQMPNGLPSPTSGHYGAAHSPTHAAPAPYPPYPPRQGPEPMQSPMGPQQHPVSYHQSPPSAHAQSNYHHHPPPPQHQAHPPPSSPHYQPPPPQIQPRGPPPPLPQMQQRAQLPPPPPPPLPPQQQQRVPSSSPHVNQARPVSQAGRSSTPSAGEQAGMGGVGASGPATSGGASTSPSLNNLLS